jgi:16S rRNA (guanine527-N7)-methyltransferase
MNDGLDLAAGRRVSRETGDQVQVFAQLLRDESSRQNLIAASTLETLWERHILDSAQLARFGPSSAKWVDVGSGAGLPGIILAALLPRSSVTLVEPRRLRAEFLERAVQQLGLDTKVITAKVERVGECFDVITARAVASLDRVLRLTSHLSHPGTLWVLPKGRKAKSELEEARRSWHYEVRVEPSITDPASEILLLSKVKAKSSR